MRKLLLITLLLFGAILALPMFSSSASAATDSFTASETWDASSCTGTVNGASQTNGESQVWEYVNNGDQVNFTVTNNSNQKLYLTMSGTDQTSSNQYLTPGNNATYSLEISNYIDLQASSTTCNGNSNYTQFWIEGASGSLSCSISDSKVWNVTGQYNGVENPTLYNGSTYEATIQNDKGGPGVGGATIDEQFSGETNSATYYLYDGSSSADALIGQATCPAITANVTKPPTSSSPAATTTATPQAAASAPSSSTTTTTTPVVVSTVPKTESNITPVISLAATNDNFRFSAVALPWIIVAAIFVVLMVISFWRVLTKAGRHGWIALIPVYNSWVVYEIGGYPGWWAIVSLVPVANIVALFVFLLACLKIADRFGKSRVFGVLGLFIFSFVGWPILAFGRTTYAKIEPSRPDNI